MIIISFKKSIYPLKAIKKSAQAYKKLAKFNFSEKEGYYITKISKIDKEVEDIIKDEFSNNVLSQIKQ